jgi:hypothetical protein
MSANRMVRPSSGPANKSCRQEARHVSYGSMLLKKSVTNDERAIFDSWQTVFMIRAF